VAVITAEDPAGGISLRKTVIRQSLFYGALRRFEPRAVKGKRSRSHDQEYHEHKQQFPTHLRNSYSDSTRPGSPAFLAELVSFAQVLLELHSKTGVSPSHAKAG
jgi:hypothetical protein